MKIEQKKWTAASGWDACSPTGIGATAQLVFVFGATSVLKNSSLLGEVAQFYPGAHLFGCSTAGEISGAEVSDDSLVVTAVRFEHTQLRVAQVSLSQAGGSALAGEKIGKELSTTKSLCHVFVLSDGLKANGTELLAGLTRALPAGVAVTGGLAGDGARFAETFVLCEGQPRSDTVAALGFYSDRLKVGCSSFGGWDAFGPERRITKSHKNVLFELDGQSALMLYKKYLGDQAKDLPGSGLLFPLSVRAKDATGGVVRTILSVNEAEQSMTFAGDMPEGSLARLMKANFDRLIDGAGQAATSSQREGGVERPELVVLISCVGRKLVLKQRVEEEVEAVREVLGPQAVLTGFYSYGEISPFTSGGKCELHNQTMTVVNWSET